MSHGFKKVWVGLVLAVMVFVGLSVSAPREASAMRCASYTFTISGPVCDYYRPDYPPGGRDCTGAPGLHEINIYTGVDKTGFCVTLPQGMGWWILNGYGNGSGNGWYGYYYIRTIEVGSAVPSAQACGSIGCPLLWAHYTFTYYNPPYNGTSSPGFQSIYNP